MSRRGLRQYHFQKSRSIVWQNFHSHGAYYSLCILKEKERKSQQNGMGGNAARDGLHHHGIDSNKEHSSSIAKKQLGRVDDMYMRKGARTFGRSSLLWLWNPIKKGPAERQRQRGQRTCSCTLGGCMQILRRSHTFAAMKTIRSEKFLVAAPEVTIKVQKP